MDSSHSFIWIHCPTASWPPWFLMRNLLIIILKIPYLWLSSPRYFHDFSLCLAFQSLIMCLQVDLWVPLGVDAYMHAFHQIFYIFSHYFFKYSLFLFSLFSFWDSHDACVDLLDEAPQVWGSLQFSQSFFFLFLRLHNFHCLIFKFSDPFFCLLESAFQSYSEFFILVIVLFSSRTFCSYLFRISISLLIFLFCSHIVFFYSFHILL